MKRRSWLQDKDKRQKWMLFMQDFHPEIDPEALRLMDELGFVFRSVHRMNEQSIEEAGLSFAQYQVLMHLFFAEQVGDKEELNPSEISDRQGVSRNTMSAFIRNLEEKELIERCLDPHDRRRFNISLTESGRELVRQYTRDHLESVSRCFSALTSEEKFALSVLLQKLGTHVKAIRSGAEEACAAAPESGSSAVAHE